MNSTTILQSNLLDIIFENRNKDYGAYRLRKFYNDRLSIAVLIILSVVILFSLFQFFWSNADDSVKKTVVFKTPDSNASKFENKTKAILLPAKYEKKIQNIIPAETPPQIVDEKNINKKIASINPPLASDLIISGNEQLGKSEEGKNLTGENKLPIPDKPKSSNLSVLTEAEIMPQYPGGLKALLAI